MKILIIEGIATSGKSTLVKLLSEIIGKDSVRVFGEPDTHEPIMDEPEDLHLEFFKSLLEDAAKSDTELVIFDRLHFTQAFRAKTTIKAFEDIENSLAGNNTFVAYLKVDEEVIANRIKLAIELRDDSWGEYVRTKGSTLEEIAKYYADQQYYQIELLQQSKLKCRIFNSTQHNYREIADQISSILDIVAD